MSTGSPVWATYRMRAENVDKATTTKAMAAVAVTTIANIGSKRERESECVCRCVYIAIVIHRTIAYFNHVGLTVCHRHLSQFSLYILCGTHTHILTWANEYNAHNKRHSLSNTVMSIWPLTVPTTRTHTTYYHHINPPTERCTYRSFDDDVTYSINFFFFSF